MKVGINMIIPGNKNEKASGATKAKLKVGRTYPVISAPSVIRVYLVYRLPYFKSRLSRSHKREEDAKENSSIFTDSLNMVATKYCSSAPSVRKLEEKA